MILIVHLNLITPSKSKLTRRVNLIYPTLGIRFCAAIGNTTPPTEAPTAIYPNTRPRLFLNQWARIACVGEKTPPHPNCDGGTWLATSSDDDCYQGTNPASYTLAQQELPKVCTLRSKECSDDEQDTGGNKNITEVTQVEKPSNYETREENQGILQAKLARF